VIPLLQRCAPAHLFLILNSFCLDCYLHSDNPPTLDPRSTFLHNPPNVLETPSLPDVSECSHENTWGEAAVGRHDGSPDPVQHDRTESVSDASQCVSVVGGVVRDLSLSANSSVSTPSSPSLDDESANHTSISPSSSNTTARESVNGSMPGQLPSLAPSSTRTPHAGPNVQAVAPTHLPNGQYMCPRCPRKFLGLAKARYEPSTLDLMSDINKYQQSSCSDISTCL
jgi:hypothetical protein